MCGNMVKGKAEVVITDIWWHSRPKARHDGIGRYVYTDFQSFFVLFCLRASGFLCFQSPSSMTRGL